RDNDRHERELRQTRPRVRRRVPGEGSADEREGVYGSGNSERRERPDCGPARRPRAYLCGELVRDLGRCPEPLERAVVGAEMVFGLGEDPPPEPDGNTNVDELAVERLEIELDHVTTASTACANACHSSRSRASSPRPRFVSSYTRRRLPFAFVQLLESSPAASSR